MGWFGRKKQKKVGRTPVRVIVKLEYNEVVGVKSSAVIDLSYVDHLTTSDADCKDMEDEYDMLPFKS